MSVWYYVINKERMGPVSEADIISKIKNHEIDEMTYVWRKGLNNWVYLKDVEELSSQTKILNEAGDGEPMPEVIGDDPSVEFDWNDLDHDAKIFTIKIGVDRGQEESIYGPYSLDTLKKLLQQERVNEKTLIFAPGFSKWTFLADTPVIENLGDGLPPKISEVDRRQYSRRPFVARLLFHDRQKVMDGICRDISIGGLQIIVADLPCKKGDEISMNVHPDNSDYCFVAKGKIVRVLEGGNGFSLRFIDLGDEAKAAIQDYINRHD